MKKISIAIIFLLIISTLLLIGCNSKNVVNNSAINANKESTPKSPETEEKNKLDKDSTDSSTSKDSKIAEPSKAISNNVEILVKGSKGEKVLTLQKKLYSIGYDIEADGNFGNLTVSILKDFQQKYNLSVTGSLTSETDAKLSLIKDIRVYPSSKPSSSTAQSIQSQPSAPSQTLENIAGIKTSPGSSKQVIIVLADSYGTKEVTVKAYEKDASSWTLVNSCSGVIGKKGFSANRKEGDQTTPTGKYGFPFLFGHASNPGFKLPYRIAGVNDYWVSNKILEEYNIWMHYDGANPKERLYDYEELWKIPTYKYAAVIDFNYGSGKVLGKGSAIFLHITPSSGGGTLGCVAVSESNLVKMLKWMDPAKNPSIIMGVKGKI